MSKALIILGASGFLGRHLVQRYHNLDMPVYALSRSRSLKIPKVIWLKLNKDTPLVIGEILQQYPDSKIIHCAGRINGSKKQIHHDNVTLTKDLLEAIKISETQPQLIYISSVSAIDQLGNYGKAKFTAEELIRLSPVKNWQILRCSLLYGGGDRKNVATLVNAVKYYPMIPVIGSDCVKLQPLYVKDILPVIDKLLKGQGKKKQIYLLAGPKQIYLKEMIQNLQDKFSKEQKLIHVPLKPIQAISKHLGSALPFINLPFQQIAYLNDHPCWCFNQAREDLEFEPREFAEGINDYLS